MPTGWDPLEKRGLLEAGDHSAYPKAEVKPGEPEFEAAVGVDVGVDGEAVDGEVVDGEGVRAGAPAATAQMSFPFFFTQTNPPGRRSPLILHAVPGVGGPGIP